MDLGKFLVAALISSVGVFSSDEESKAKALFWADYLKVSLNGEGSYLHRLIFANNQVELKDPENRTLRIDFDENSRDYQRKHRGKNELLSKALGYTKGVRKVLDLSVGLAIDSVFLIQLGFEVQGVERSPALYVLLEEAFRRTQKPWLQSYKLWHAEALDFLTEQKDKIAVDAIYFDPMYPMKKKSALPRQEMLVFREMVGHDEDAAQVLDRALQWSCQRVVVKRPLQAPPLRDGVLHTYEGKLVRYDVYRRNA